MRIKRPLLLVFTPIYALITFIRNKLFDWGVLKSRSFHFPVIGVGNLNVGGTGKTPHIMYLIELLTNSNKIAVLSRGYGRETKGFQLASGTIDEKIIGDEPAEIKARFSNIIVAVDEKRVHGIERLMNVYPDIETILLDDSFQHRYVKPKLSILLTSANDLFADDFHLPAGNLREFASGKKRAQVIIVTKCGQKLSSNKKDEILKKIKPLKHQSVFFSRLEYKNPIKKDGTETEIPNRFILVTGIAEPIYLMNYLKNNQVEFNHLQFKDHHSFSISDYKSMKMACKEFNTNTILTTTKDYMRFDLSKDELENIDILQIPIRVQLLKNEDDFKGIILNSLSEKS